MPGNKFTVEGKKQGLLGQAFTMPGKKKQEPPKQQNPPKRNIIPNMFKRNPPKRTPFQADPTIVQDIGRKSPKIRAPAPEHNVGFAGTANNGNMHFDHLQLLGEGGQGRCDTFRRPDGKVFVRKIMKGPIQVEKDPSGETKPLEVKIIKDILGKHERLCKLYNYEWSPTRTVLWFENCAGGDLNDIITAYHKNHKLQIPEGFLWHVYLQLAEAAAFIHQCYDRTDFGDRKTWQHIVHRDIKPQNVFVRKPIDQDHYPDVVLADFGLATTRRTSGESGVCGTILWQGPEVPLHSAPGDIWAVGACVHALATGGAPVKAVPKGYDAFEWYKRHDSRCVKVLTDAPYNYSKQLDSALYKVMRTNPHDRMIGKELVTRVERGWTEWKGNKEGLEEWALKC